MVCPTGKVKRQVKAYSRCQKAAPTKRMKAARKRVGKAAAKKGAKGDSWRRAKAAAAGRAMSKRRAGVSKPKRKIKIKKKFLKKK